MAARRHASPRAAGKRVLGRAASSAPVVGGAGAGRRGRVFQGGFYRDLHRMLGVASGTEARRDRGTPDAGVVAHSLL